MLPLPAGERVGVRGASVSERICPSSRSLLRVIFSPAGSGFWLALLLALVAFPALAAPTFPKLTGRVVDAANILPEATRASITAKLEALEAKTTDQVVVATVPDLQGYDISEYGYQLGRAWGIGQKGKDNGVVLLVAPNERRVRIDVGYGLEGTLTDALSSLIIQNQILPRFREGDMSGGVEAGVDAIVEQLGLPPAEAQARVAQAAEAQRQANERSDVGPGGFFWLALILFWLFLSFARRRHGRRYRRSGVGEAILWGLATGAMNSRSRGGGWGGGGFGGGGFGAGGGSFGGGGASGGW